MRGVFVKKISFFFLGLCLCFGIGVPVYSAFEPQGHGSLGSADPLPSLKTTELLQPDLLNLAGGDAAVDIALKDPSQKIDPQFHVAPELQGSVRFWLMIYTQLTSNQMVFYDRLHPEVVYEVVDFSDLFSKSRNAIVFDVLKEHRIKAKCAAYAQAFSKLGAKRQRGPLTEEGKNILAAWSKYSGARPSYKELREELRSQTGQRDNVIHGLYAAEAYFPKMETVFAQLGLPRELLRLSLVESSFELRANSKVGAIGVWQFMPGPGEKLLRIDPRVGIDERLSPLKSTVAAGKILKENYNRFQNWPLTVTAYNHGLRGLMDYRKNRINSKKAPKKIAQLFSLASKRSPLGFAAKNYYCEFLAMVYAESYRELFYGDIPTMPLRPVSYQTVVGKKSALRFAIENGLSVEQFRMANPEITEFNRTLPDGMLVAVPGESDNLTALTRRPSRKRFHSRVI